MRRDRLQSGVELFDMEVKGLVIVDIGKMVIGHR
jgi:hypothetical protein